MLSRLMNVRFLGVPHPNRGIDFANLLGEIGSNMSVPFHCTDLRSPAIKAARSGTHAASRILGNLSSVACLTQWARAGGRPAPTVRRRAAARSPAAAMAP